MGMEFLLFRLFYGWQLESEASTGRQILRRFGSEEIYNLIRAVAATTPIANFLVYPQTSMDARKYLAIWYGWDI